MPRTARRRWSRELDLQVDGVAFGEAGPVIVHGYEFPAGGKWLDDAIPGKLVALERGSGGILWTAPCEIGYGRGFGAGFGADGEIVVLGPSVHGHSIARMSAESGEVIGAREIDAFDEAQVFTDLCICVAARRVFGVLPTEMLESWVYARENERYHQAVRAGSLLYVGYSNTQTRMHGVLALHADTGEYAGDVLPPALGCVHAMATDVGAHGSGAVGLFVEEFEAALSPDALRDWLTEQAARQDPDAESPRFAIMMLPPQAESGIGALWLEGVLADDDGEAPSVSLCADSGKLYAARGTLLGVRDALTGRLLGEESVAGLDEYVAWRVRSGAALLAEETRVSVFEVPD